MCTDLAGKWLHRWIGVDRVFVSGSLDNVIGHFNIYKKKDVTILHIHVHTEYPTLLHNNLIA